MYDPWARAGSLVNQRDAVCATHTAHAIHGVGTVVSVSACGHDSSLRDRGGLGGRAVETRGV